MENKTHYRKVFKSDHLGVADLEEYIEEKRPLIFTIKEVKQEFNVSIAGRKGNHNIAYFIDGIKPLVLNATNSKIVKSFNKNSPFVEDWKMTKIELYIDYNVKMKGEVVGGVRIKAVQPKDKVKPNFTEANFEKAKKANATIEQIKKAYNITIETGVKYLDYVAKN
jgi:hypothetical protein